ncbi:hypothetical protein AOL_s00215g386 [Orbilia oligospora ATCC 24927]|uniref:Probable kinetochore protein NDC80 n=1 Tax=Arthrobotrys oligospora (strain ATCC 24927 / CBS 115.81 / DSM 1491) TaxID=756982 RepID=G1XUA7_ARTOA|nr:hypothetical protein AOL_s00215g386 [Orbilia oligospora ATCC 24927]EGX43650.1 hypothetical protein AOL_s00215g386 [Orbilia oligospora ATCC 24927]
MSQDTNLFSAFKRPRETISGITSIPQPTSALKRSASNQGLQQGGRPSAPNFRHSMLPARSGGSLAGNLLDMGAQASNRRESRIGGLGGGGGGFNIPSSRKSYAPTSSTPQMMDQRRSSIYSRPSMGANIGGGAGGSFFGSSGGSAIAGAGLGKVTDPRPLRDPNFRNKMAQEIQEYLLRYNFELETKHNLGPKALSSPMQKDFTTIFQWLYHRMDPNFKFSLKSVETEVMPLLKGIKYPYLGNITKAQLGAVGGANNWPTYLGLLHWMVQLVQALENFDSGHYDDAIEQQSLDIGTSKVGYRYLSQCYTTWLNDDDDFSPFKDEMVEEFEARSAQDQESLVVLKAEYDQLVSAISELEDESGKSPLDRLKSEGETLRNDQDKFRKFIDHQREKMGHIKAVNAALKDEGEASRQEITRLEVEKAELQQAVDRQGLSTADIDRMNTEREKLIKGLEGVEIKLEEANGVAAGREAEALKKLELLEHAVKRYNELGYKIGVTSNGQSCEIDIIPLTKAAQSAPEGSSGDDERLLYDVGVGYNPRQVLTLDLRHDVKPTLNTFRNEIATRIHSAQDVSIKNQDRLDNIQETLKDKSEELETLEAKLSAVNDEYSEIKETSATETSASNAEIEKLERELQSMRINAQSGLLALEQRLQSVNIEYDQLAHGAHVLREFYHAEIEKMLQTIINLKMHIQGSLAGWDAETLEELETYRESLDKKLSTGTLTRDAKEIALCISYFKIQLSRPKVVVLGHSTGCQDIMHYLCRLEVSQQAHGQLDGAILQAPVSDREALAMMMGKETYERSWKHAQRLVKSGRGGDIMPAQITKEVFEAPCSAFRWYSLTSPNMDGEDDFFSSDIGEDILEGTFGAVVPAGTPLLVCYSGEDEFVPLTVDKEGLVEKWVRVCVRKGVNVDVKNSGVVKKATHNFAGCEGEVFEDFLGRVRRFLKVVEDGGKFGAGGAGTTTTTTTTTTTSNATTATTATSTITTTTTVGISGTGGLGGGLMSSKV